MSVFSKIFENEGKQKECLLLTTYYTKMRCRQFEHILQFADNFSKKNLWATYCFILLWQTCAKCHNGLMEVSYISFSQKKELLLPRKQYASLKTKLYKKNQYQQMKVYKKCYVLQDDKIRGTKFDYWKAHIIKVTSATKR